MVGLVGVDDMRKGVERSMDDAVTTLMEEQEGIPTYLVPLCMDRRVSKR